MRSLAYWRARLELARTFNLPDEEQLAEGFIRALHMKEYKQQWTGATGDDRASV